MAVPALRYCLCIICFLFIMAAPAAAQEVVRIGGTGAGLGTLKVIGVAFEKSHPGVKVIVLPSIGSGGAIKAAAQGALEIGISGRPLSKDETGLGLSALEFASTPFIPIVHSGVPRTGITTGEIVKIYSGEMTLWPNGERIRLVVRPASDVDTFIVRDISPEMRGAVDAALSRPGMLTGINDQQNVALVESTPGAFGFSTLSQVSTERPKVTMLSWNGVVPSVSALAKGVYPSSKRFFFVTKAPLPAAARTFLEFVRSEKGRKLLEQTGNLPFDRDQRN